MPKSSIASLLDASDPSAAQTRWLSSFSAGHTAFANLSPSSGNENPIVRRAAEKVFAQKPRLLDRHKAALLGLLAEAEQIELR